MLKRFSVQVLIRVLLIVVATILLEFIYGDERLFFNQIILAIVLTSLVYNLIWYVSLCATRSGDMLTSYFWHMLPRLMVIIMLFSAAILGRAQSAASSEFLQLDGRVKVIGGSEEFGHNKPQGPKLKTPSNWLPIS